jgi:arabinan endo-1,5-alpha-L-arabinosidase
LTVENGSADDGANISLEEFTGDISQKFSLYGNSDGSYVLLSAASGSKSCADVYGISLDDGANICQWNYWGGNGQNL